MTQIPGKLATKNSSIVKRGQMDRKTFRIMFKSSKRLLRRLHLAIHFLLGLCFHGCHMMTDLTLLASCRYMTD